MTSKPDGGPAFPRTLVKDRPYGQFEPEDGMTLRDWMAGMALQGMCTQAFESALIDKETGKKPTTGKFAREAYNFADAMLAERSK